MPVQLSGQDSVKERPIVGLVLSGGAARGISQIGVLKVLESEGIYPDIITGCSMGGVIGGLYAIGYSPMEMDSIFRYANWSTILSDDIPLNRVRMTEKRDYDNNLLKLQFDWDRKPSLPMSAIHGQNMAEKLGEITWHAAGISDFDSLRVPYRAAVVELVNSKLHYLSKGDVKTAIRSTLAIPSVFYPVILDTMLMVDGGILCNFPVLEAKRMGAGSIIGVYTSYNEHIKLEEMHSMVKILSRATFITGVCDVRRQLNEVDILVRPGFKTEGPEDFKKSVDIMNIGEKAAQEKLDTLKQFAQFLRQFPEPERRTVPRIESYYITDIAVKGNQGIDEQFIITWSGLSPGCRIAYPEVKEAIRNIYSTLIFDNVDYLLEKREGGYDLIFRVVEREPGLLSVGAHYDNDFRTGIVVEAQYRNLLFSADRLYAGANISQNSQMRVDYTSYFGKRMRNFITLQFDGENTNLPYYFTIDTLTSEHGKIRQKGWNTELKLGAMIGLNSAVTLSGAYEWWDYSFSEGLDDWYGMKQIRYGSFRTKADFSINTMDRAYFPGRGVKLYVRTDYVVTNPGGYFKLYGAYDHLVRLHKLFSAGLHARAGWISNTPLMYDRFYLGGDHFIPRFNMVNGFGLGVYRLNVTDFATAGLTLQFNIKDEFYLSARGSLFSLDTFSDPGTDLANTFYGYGISAGYRSILGPIKLSLYSNSLDGDLQWLFNFSYPF